MPKRLTEEAEWLKFDFEHNTQGCACHTGCAPCSHCTHEGNCIEEFEEAYEEYLHYASASSYILAASTQPQT